MDDFQEDPITGIALQDPVFIENREIVCYTVTHEGYCDISYDLFLELQK